MKEREPKIRRIDRPEVQRAVVNIIYEKKIDLLHRKNQRKKGGYADNKTLWG